MEIQVKKMSRADAEKQGVLSWPTWEKEVSRFDWHYDAAEDCYLLEGSVIVSPQDGKSVSFGAGDFVSFPKGLSCVWEVKAPVRKHYNFK